MITNPRLSTFYVVDQRLAADFLTKHLGFRMITDVPYGEGRRWIEVRPPAAQTSVALAAVSERLHTELAEEAGRMAHGWLDCTDLDATCARLRDDGVRVVVGPSPAPWAANRRWAQIADPAGNLYGLTEPATDIGDTP